jgi:transcriptional regulator with XRE-family HTH domain
MFTNHPVLDIFDYICAQNAQCWARITKSNMEIQRYNRLKIVLAERERTGTWLSEQMGHSISTVSRWMTNKVQPSVEQLYDIAKHLDVDVRELLVSTK